MVKKAQVKLAGDGGVIDLLTPESSPSSCRVFVRSPGSEIPPQATLVFDVLLVDLHNPKDTIIIEEQTVPETCTRRTVVGDFIRYHYNGTFLNGITFDTR